MVSKGLWHSPRYGGVMDEAVRARRAAHEAVDDVTPARLGEHIDELLADAWTPPGALTLLFARAADPPADPDAAEERAAAVQLVYEGLRLTRRLAHEEPWADRADHTGPNLDILAADVIVSRGFYVLARTEAADKAVRTIRRFGRDQTRLRTGDADPAVNCNLEADTFELAAIAGTTTAGAEPTEAVLAYATDLAATMDTPPGPDPATLPESTRHTIANLADGADPPTADGPATSPATDP